MTNYIKPSIVFLILFLKSTFSMAGGFAVFKQQQIVVTATVTSTKFMDQNTNRNYLLIQNNGATNVTVTFGAAQTGSEGIIIPPGGSYEPIKAFWDAVYLKAASSTDAVVLIEGY